MPNSHIKDYIIYKGFCYRGESIDSQVDTNTWWSPGGSRGDITWETSPCIGPIQLLHSAGNMAKYGEISCVQWVFSDYPAGRKILDGLGPMGPTGTTQRKIWRVSAGWKQGSWFNLNIICFQLREAWNWETRLNPVSWSCSLQRCLGWFNCVNLSRIAPWAQELQRLFWCTQVGSGATSSMETWQSQCGQTGGYIMKNCLVCWRWCLVFPLVHLLTWYAVLLKRCCSTRWYFFGTSLTRDSQ